MLGMTKLKKKYATKDEVPADFTGAYVEKGGEMVLDIEIEGLIPASRLDPFRTNNTKAKEFLEQYGTVEEQNGTLAFTPRIDPKVYDSLKAREDELKDDSAIKEKVDKRVTAATKEMQETNQRETAKKDQQIADLKGKLKSTLIKSEALSEATQFGILKNATDAFTLMIDQAWTLDESGEPVAYEADGKTIKLNENGDPMKGKEALKFFVKKMATDTNKFMFAPNEGGGGDSSVRGSGSQSDNGDVNLWDMKIEMPDRETKQAQMYKKDFPKAQRMAARHGVQLPQPKASAAKTVGNR